MKTWTSEQINEAVSRLKRLLPQVEASRGQVLQMQGGVPPWASVDNLVGVFITQLPSGGWMVDVSFRDGDLCESIGTLDAQPIPSEAIAETVAISIIASLPRAGFAGQEAQQTRPDDQPIFMLYGYRVAVDSDLIATARAQIKEMTTNSGFRLGPPEGLIRMLDEHLTHWMGFTGFDPAKWMLGDPRARDYTETLLINLIIQNINSYPSKDASLMRLAGRTLN